MALLHRVANANSSGFGAGQIAASLAGLSRTIEDYDSMAKREMIKAKQEKAFMYVELMAVKEG